ncbi:MAG: carboxypeptidase regulatory-like domain-containing protein [Desulfobacteraceae bacterium]|nr:carboxypeptidase regulatory-like domain-containing protein [Desulfobacteraceae bacterium]
MIKINKSNIFKMSTICFFLLIFNFHEAYAEFPGSVIGYILESPSHDKIDGVNITITPSDYVKVHYYPDYGIYYIYGLDPTTYTITVTSPDYNSSSVDVEIQSLVTTRKDIYLTQHATY